MASDISDSARYAVETARAETTANRDKHRYSVYLNGRPGNWVARCYDDNTDEHVWSSEAASSVGLALREIAEGIERRRDATTD